MSERATRSGRQAGGVTRLPVLVPPPAELPPAAAALRADVREFLAGERAAGLWQPRPDVWLSGWDERFTRELGRRGWLGMTIPTRYGGRGGSSLDRYVVTEELLAAGAPVAAHWVADRQIGPTLLRFGTEAQRQRYLPRIAAGECYFGIGMSEPDSGSDLASVRTRAVRVDGGWELTGTKVWTSGAHRAHAFFALARTAPRDDTARHAGLSQFVVELDSPGVTIRPIPLLTGAHHFNEVVFDAVFVPDAMVLGEIGAGWHQVTSELAFERSGPERFLSTFPLLVALVAELSASRGLRQREPGSATGRVGVSDSASREIGALVARLWTLRRMSLAVAGSLASGEAPELAAAVVKDLGTRFENEVIDAARQLHAVPPDPGAEGGYARLLADAVLHAPGFTLRGGTNEVLRGIVARGLGLR
ncbi:MAG: acyl-CoA dehydrogenase family protein [Pseudonocardia sp.]